MIAYHILCHDNFKQVSRLIESLYSEADTFLIDIDDGKKPNTKAINGWLKKDNVHVKHDANIGWGASGTLRKTFNGALSLLELDANWEYYVVLSGQDLPLKSNTHIKEVLAKGAKNRINFIRCYEPPVLDLADIPINNKGKRCMQWGDRGHTRVFAKPGAIDPQHGMYARTLVDVAEVGEQGAVYVGTADPFLRKYRAEYFSKYPFHTGANWFNLHRSFIEHMAEDPFTYELYSALKTSFIPDESFFQTCIMNGPFRHTVSQNYGRLILRPGPVPKVKVFERSDWPVISECSELYGRKFDSRHDARIINTVLKSRLIMDEVA